MGLIPYRKRDLIESIKQFPRLWEDFPNLISDFDEELNVKGLTVYEDKNNNLVIEAEIPGFKKDEINIDLTQGVLWITAEKKEEHKDRKYITKTTSSRSLRYALPANVDEKEEPKAVFKDGILQIVFHKTKSSETKKISIKD